VASTGKRSDWLHRHNFMIEIDGKVDARFQEVTGLEYGFDVVEYREGGNWTSTRKFQGQGRAGNIILRRGLAKSFTPFRDWVASSEGTKPLTRLSGSIILCDDAGREVKRWNFTNSWPVRWRGADMDARGNKDLAIEELEIAVETLELQTEGGGTKGGG